MFSACSSIMMRSSDMKKAVVVLSYYANRVTGEDVEKVTSLMSPVPVPPVGVSCALAKWAFYFVSVSSYYIMVCT